MYSPDPPITPPFPPDLFPFSAHIPHIIQPEIDSADSGFTNIHRTPHRSALHSFIQAQSLNTARRYLGPTSEKEGSAPTSGQVYPLLPKKFSRESFPASTSHALVSLLHVTRSSWRREGIRALSSPVSIYTFPFCAGCWYKYQLENTWWTWRVEGSDEATTTATRAIM
jgi:hypothetical protein